MQAIVLDRYGSPDMLELRDVDKPTPGADDVLVRVRAAGVNRADGFILTGRPYVMRLATGLFRPKTNGLGADLAGVVEAIGGNVTRFVPGDEVFGEVEMGACFAEYACVPQDGLEHKPANLSFEQAAAVPMAALTALQALRDKGRIAAGQKVLINGASGGVGTFAVQIARFFDARVTGVCSTPNMALVRSLGADRVIDYTREDFTQVDERYDLMLDNVGNRSLRQCRCILKADAIYIPNGGSDGRWLGPAAHLLATLALAPFVSQRVVSVLETANPDDLRILKDLLETEKLTPIIDRTYRLNQTPQALTYLQTHRARGKVIIIV